MDFQDIDGSSLTGATGRATFFPRKTNRRNADDLLLSLETRFLFLVVIQFQSARVTLYRTAWAANFLARSFATFAAAASLFRACGYFHASFTLARCTFDAAFTRSCFCSTTAVASGCGSDS